MRILTGLVLLTGAAAAQSLTSRVEQLHSRRDLSGEVKLLRNRAASSNLEDRAYAERRLGWIAWWFHLDFQSAGAHFDRSLATGSGRPETLSAQARMEAARGEFQQARLLARKALECASTARDREQARVMFANATVEEAFRTGKSQSAPEALALIREVVREQPGVFTASRLMYALALLTGDKEAVRESLESYHWGDRLTPLYPEAGLAGTPPDVVNYSRFCRRVREIAEDHYRQFATGAISDPHPRVKAAVLEAARKVYPGVSTAEDLNREIRGRFDAEIRFENFGLVLGHRVLNEDRVFVQYGRRVSVPFVILDSMVMNGYTTWFSDGRSMIGGWAGPPMTQVRRDDALRAWIGMTDPERRRQFDSLIQKASLQDDAAAQMNPSGYFEGLMHRLHRRSHAGMIEALESRGLAGRELRLAFLRQFQERHTGCVQAHEARHLIDRGKVTGYRFEMYAAIAQPLFGPDPVTCLAGVFGPNIGAKDNGSGEGNGHIMRGLAAWMEAHASEIRGLNLSRPLLPQFDLLSDEQIRAAFRSMDPLAKPDSGQ